VQRGRPSRRELHTGHRSIETLEAHAVLGLLYESPFTGIAPQRPEELFSDEKAIQLIDVIAALSSTEPAKVEAS